MITDDEFMKSVEQDYPGVDWDNLPPLESSPDVWVISGQCRHDRTWLDKQDQTGKPWVHDYHFEIGHEYKSLEEAEAKVESMKTDPNWLERVDERHKDRPSCPYTEVVTLLPDTLTIQKKKSWELASLHLTKSFRDEILAGQKVFPMYLP